MIKPASQALSMAVRTFDLDEVEEWRHTLVAGLALTDAVDCLLADAAVHGLMALGFYRAQR